MTTARKLRVLNTAAKVLLLGIVILQLTQVISGFASIALIVIVGAPTTVAWVILVRRLGAEKMGDSA